MIEELAKTFFPSDMGHKINEIIVWINEYDKKIPTVKAFNKMPKVDGAPILFQHLNGNRYTSEEIHRIVDEYENNLSAKVEIKEEDKSFPFTDKMLVRVKEDNDIIFRYKDRGGYHYDDIELIPNMKYNWTGSVPPIPNGKKWVAFSDRQKYYSDGSEIHESHWSNNNFNAFMILEDNE